MQWRSIKPRTEGPQAGALQEQKSELLWLVLLLTGDPTLSLETVTGTPDSHDDSSPFFREWLVTWSRKLVIARALGAVEFGMAASIRSLEARQERNSPATELPPASWSATHEVSRTHLERALIAIDIFPRWVLLLTVFEKVSLDDVAVLLNADRQLVNTARTIGLMELARNVAIEQGWKPEQTISAPSRCRMHHTH